MVINVLTFWVELLGFERILDIDNLKMIYVIIPTYNRANTIIRAINSVLRNNNMFCIVIDDWSTDNTKNLIDSYLEKNKDYKNKLFYFYKENWWACDAINYWINKLLKLSKDYYNDYFLILWSDDELSIDSYEKINKYINIYNSYNSLWFTIYNKTDNKVIFSFKENIEEINFKNYIENYLDKMIDVAIISKISKFKNTKNTNISLPITWWEYIPHINDLRENPAIFINETIYFAYYDWGSITRSVVNKDKFKDYLFVAEIMFNNFWEDFLKYWREDLYYKFLSIMWISNNMLWNKRKWWNYLKISFVKSIFMYPYFSILNLITILPIEKLLFLLLLIRDNIKRKIIYKN